MQAKLQCVFKVYILDTFYEIEYTNEDFKIF